MDDIVRGEMLMLAIQHPFAGNVIADMYEMHGNHHGAKWMRAAAAMGARPPCKVLEFSNREGR